MCVVVVGLSSTAAYLGQGEVDAKRCVFVREELLDFGNLLLKGVGGERQSTDDAETSRVGDGRDELRVGDAIHTRKQNCLLFIVVSRSLPLFS